MLGGAGLTPVSVAAQGRTVVWNLPHVAAPTYYLTDLFLEMGVLELPFNPPREELHKARALVSSLRCCTILVHLHQRGADVGAGRRRSDHRIHTP